MSAPFLQGAEGTGKLVTLKPKDQADSLTDLPLDKPLSAVAPISPDFLLLLISHPACPA